MNATRSVRCDSSESIRITNVLLDLKYLERLVAGTRHSGLKSLFPEILAQLQSNGYKVETLSFLGDGAESAAYLILTDDDQERCLKLTYPLLGSWQPDWGRREFDALLFDVEGESVHETDSGCFWFVQEYATTYERAEDIDESLWQDFEEHIERCTENLFLDDTGLVKQVGVVDREIGQCLVLLDYAAFSSQDFNAPSFSNLDEC